MVVAVKDMPGGRVVALSGEVDLQNSPKVREALLDALQQPGTVVADLGDITYIDSSGIASLVEGLQVAKRQGGRFALARVSPAALRVLSLARLDKVFTLYDTVEQAMTDASTAGSGG